MSASRFPRQVSGRFSGAPSRTHSSPSGIWSAGSIRSMHGELTGASRTTATPCCSAIGSSATASYCLKVKLRGNDAAWDYDRLVRVGRIGPGEGRAMAFAPTSIAPSTTRPTSTRFSTAWRATSRPIFDVILYVEQPFPYELEAAPNRRPQRRPRKPLFMDESAHDLAATCSSAGRWVGPASRSRRAKRKPARSSHSAGRGRTAWR